jgi:hypothetical protein
VSKLSINQASVVQHSLTYSIPTVYRTRWQRTGHQCREYLEQNTLLRTR